MKLNQSAVQHAKRLIKDGSYVVGSDWSEDHSWPAQENSYLDEHTWDEYGRWYLGIDPKEDTDAKGHYRFPYGDFNKVHRSGLIAVKRRAAQNGYHEIEQAADNLLAMINEHEGMKT